MQALLRQKNVDVAISDQCMYGLMTHGKNGDLVHAKKPTKWASSSPQMLARLRTRCDKTHDHQHLMGGRAKDAAFYPPELITEILRGMRDTADAAYQEESVSTALDFSTKRAGSLHDQPAFSIIAAYKNADLSQSNAKRRVKFQYLDGRTTSLDLEPHFKELYKDEYTTEVLPKEEAKNAIYDELSYFCDKVFRGVSYEEFAKDPEGKIIGCRWVSSNKGDAETPDVRMRLVGQEINRGDVCDDFYAATPPLEAKRLLFSDWATKKHIGGQRLKLHFTDIRKAYFNGIPTRSIYVRMPPELGLPKGTLGKLVRCMYGTRDAGAIWEQCYVDCLLGMGFVQSLASPCCFNHPDWEISVVVHGDDFTALGTDKSLDKYEAGLKAAFECKFRGRLGLDDSDAKEIRVLNRIVRINKSGLQYEADPRHVELLAKSMGLGDCKPVATPGIKKPFEDAALDLPVDDDTLPISSMDVDSGSPSKVTFSIADPEVFEVTPYRHIYGVKPKRFVFDRMGRMVKLGRLDDPFTGRTSKEMSMRLLQNKKDEHERARILRKTLIDGPAWESSTAHLIAKVSAKKMKQKRIGAKAAKAAERLESQGEVLNASEATTFRALAARANYLSLDRPECAYATKELCRFFATPTKTGWEQLKRLVRYLVGAPRLVWQFHLQDEAATLTTYVDTDFGGCHTTRRSTSGGAAMRGSHLIKHWSTTQSTVALSSAEAEITGICKGASQGLGLQSLAAGLGINLSLKVMTDATAAIGIARRRGLGKVRHLATADLWIQDRIRKKDFGLEKVPGCDNPSDIMTKNVSRDILLKHMSNLGLVYESGRAESAPSIDH